MQIKDKRNRFLALKEDLSEYRFGVCSGLKDPDYDIVSKLLNEAEKMLDLCEVTREKARAAEVEEAKTEQHTTGQ